MTKMTAELERDHLRLLCDQLTRKVNDVERELAERKGVEEALRESEEMLADFFDNGVLGLHWIGPDGIILRANQAELDLLGYTRAEYVGHLIAEFHADAEVITDILRRLQAGETLHNYEARLRCKNGSIKNVLIDSKVLWKNNQFIHAHFFTRDITDRSRAEHALRESEADLALAQRVAHLGNWRFDIASDVVVWSEELYRIFDVERNDFGGRHDSFVSRVLPNERPRVLRMNAEARASGDPFDLEYRIMTRSGEMRTIREMGFAVRTATGNVVGLFGTAQDITDRKRLEHQLRIKDFAIASSVTPTALADLEGRLTYANQAFLDRLGYERPEEVIGRLNTEFTPRPEDVRAIMTALHERGSWSGEIGTETRQGAPLVVQLVAMLVRDEAGVPVCSMATFIDITERKRAEEALRASREVNQIIMDYFPGLISVKNLTGTVIMANRQFELLKGPSPAEFVGKSVYDLFPKEVADVLWENDLAVQRADRALCSEETVEHKDGTWHTYLTTKLPLHQNDQIFATCAISTDITNQKRAEANFTKTIRTLETLIHTAPLAIVTIDRDAKITGWNPAAERLYGWSEAEVLGRLLPTIPEAEKERARSLIERSLQEEEVSGLEMRRLRKDGSLVDVSMWTAPLRNAGGEITGCIALFADVSERKKAEADVREGRERLAVLSRQLIATQETERRHLARELHDEIGQVLTAVHISLQHLTRKLDPVAAPRLEESIAIVHQAITQVRDLSLNLRPVMLDDFGLKAALDWYLERQKGRLGCGINFVSKSVGTRLPTDLNNACFRLVQEALTNVARHAQARHVWIELHQQEEEVQLLIRDDGVGFDVAAARERAIRGGSLGLLSMQERVELLDGRFTIESAPGQGTTVQANVPVPAVEEAEESR